MKKFLLILLSILIIACGNKTKQDNTKLKDPSGTIRISGAFALYPMVQKWAEEYGKINSHIKFEISAGGAGKGLVDALSGLVDIGMVSRELKPEEIAKGAWYIAVAKDAVVPTANANNGFLRFLLKSGIKKETFKQIFVTGRVFRWGQLIGNDTLDYVINVYTRSDACGASETWAKYLDSHQEDLIGTAVSGDPGVAQAIETDVLGIGYNNIAYAYDNTTKKEVTGLKVIPIDVNNNGKIDSNENFYDNKDSLIAAIKDGRYPSPPARDLYFVCKGKPTDEAVLSFISYILEGGQEFVPKTGYVKLSEKSINESLYKMSH